MKRKIFMLLAIIGFVVLMLCSCSEESYYKNEIKRLEKLGFTVVGDTDDAKEHLSGLYEEFINILKGQEQIITGNGGTGLTTDPYIQDTYSTVNNSSNSGLQNDPYNDEAIPPDKYVSEQSTTIIYAMVFDFDEENIKEAVLLRNSKDEIAIVALFNDEVSANSARLFLLDLAATNAGPWFGKMTTFVAGPKDVMFQLYPAIKHLYE